VRLRYLEAVTAAALGAAAACYLYLAWQLPVPRYTVASTPGFLPLVLGTLMLALCAALLGKALLARDAQADTVVAFSPIGLAKIAGVLLALVGYVLLLEPLGFLLSSFLFLVAVTPLFGRLPWWMWLGVPAAVAVAAHIGFVVMLRLRLPPGLLPL
jgi:putative tricarboxylic transport membrane protein